MPVGLHAGRLPDLLGAVVRQRPARGGCNQRAQQATVGGRIVEDVTLRMSTRQAAHEIHDGAWRPARKRAAQDPGGGDCGLLLVPGHTRAHPHDIADGDVPPGGAAKLRQVDVAAIVQAGDGAIVKRSTTKRRGDRLGRREARPEALRTAPHAVALQGDLAILQDQEPGRAAKGHVVAEAETDVINVEGQVSERAGVWPERPYRVAAPDDAQWPCLVQAGEARALFFGCRIRAVHRCTLGHEPSFREDGFRDRPVPKRLQCTLSWFVVGLSRWRDRARHTPPKSRQPRSIRCSDDSGGATSSSDLPSAFTPSMSSTTAATTISAAPIR